MEIRLSKPDLFFDKRIEATATAAHCYARIKWSTPTQCRFILVDRAMSDMPATFEQHDQVIGALLSIDELATIRTARATFEGLTDWQAQMKARVPA